MSKGASSRSVMKGAFLLGIAVSMVFGLVPAWGTVWHVRADGNNGNGGIWWTDAFASISTAISHAQYGDEVLVGQGTYSGAITVPDGVKIIGCYSPDGSDGPNPEMYCSTLLGNVLFMNCDSETLMQGFYINCIASEIVFIVNGSPIIKDCTIGEPYWNNPVYFGPLDNSVRCEGGSPTLVRCIIQSGPAGMYFTGESVTMNNVTLTNDGAGVFIGSENVNITGLYINDTSGLYDEEFPVDMRYALYLCGCSGKVNITDVGIANSQVPFIISGCPDVSIDGAGFYYCGYGSFSTCQLSSGNSNVKIDGLLVSNSGSSGPLVQVSSGTMNISGMGASCGSSTSPFVQVSGGSMAIKGSDLSWNVASGNAGIVQVNSGSTVEITSCVISGNVGSSVGAVVNNGGTLKVINSLITGNTGSSVGAISNAGGVLDVMNCTICSNSSTSSAYGGILTTDGGNTSVANSILYNNKASNNSVNQTSQIAKTGSGGTQTVNYCTISVGVSDLGGDENAIYDTTKACFVAASSGDYHLAANSQCIDNGNDDYVPSSVTEDLDGRLRIIHAHVDRGAYETGDVTYYVKTNGHNDADGLSWGTAFQTLGHALLVAQRGDVVRVAGGEYAEVLTIPDGVMMLGGFSPDGSGLWSLNTYETVINGSVTFVPGNSKGSRIVWFTIRGTESDQILVNTSSTSANVSGCWLDGSNCLLPSKGIYGYGGTPKVSNCRFSNLTYCTYFEEGTPQIGGLDCVSNCGVAFWLHGCAGASVKDVTTAEGALVGSPSGSESYLFRVEECTGQINIGCRIFGSSGGVGVISGDTSVANVVIENSRFAGNSGRPFMSGGVPAIIACYAPKSNITFRGCSFTENNTDGYTGSTSGAGAIYAKYGTVNIENCSFGGNESYLPGGVVFCESGARVNLLSCKFNENGLVNHNGTAVYNNGGTTSVINCLITNNLGGQVGGLYNSYGSMRVCNSTICKNKGCSSAYGGIYVNFGTATITNSILYENLRSDNGVTVSSQAATSGLSGANLSVSSCFVSWLPVNPPACFKDLNITGEPGFVSVSDYHLALNSPCHDTGYGGAPAGVTTDLDGNLRVVGTRIDRGAYECQKNVWHPEPPDIDLSGIYVARKTDGHNCVYVSGGSDTWYPLARYSYKLPDEGEVSCLASDGHYIYAGMNMVSGSTSFAAVFRYDRSMDRWEDISYGLLIASGDPQDPTYEHVSTVNTLCMRGGRLYAGVWGAGYSDSQSHSSILYRYNGSSWVLAASRPYNIEYEGCVLTCTFGSNIYCGLDLMGPTQILAYDGALTLTDESASDVDDMAASPSAVYATSGGDVIVRNGPTSWPIVYPHDDTHDPARGPIEYSGGEVYFSVDSGWPDTLMAYNPSRQQNPFWTVPFDHEGLIEEMASAGENSHWFCVRTDDDETNRIYVFYDSYSYGLIGEWANASTKVGPMLVVDNYPPYMAEMAAASCLPPAEPNILNVWTLESYATIQAAIDDANDGDVIQLQPTTFAGAGNCDIDFGGKAVTVRSINPDDPDIVAATIIDCGATSSNPHRGFWFHNGETSSSVVEGLTIRHGMGKDDNTGYYFGGAIFCDGASPTIRKCLITDNVDDSYDSIGSIACYNGSEALIEDCNISGNSSPYGMPGICALNASPTIRNCTVSGNTGGSPGIACYLGGSPQIIDCTISNNTSYYSGGLDICAASAFVDRCIITGNAGVYGAGVCSNEGSTFEGSPTLTLRDCVISQNIASDSGGGIFTAIGTSVYQNCTIVNNTATYGGGVLSMGDHSSFVNCIVYGNTATDSYPQIYELYTYSTFAYCDISGGHAGTGNIPDDPCLVDVWHLTSASPCIDVGDPSGDYGSQTDIEGDARVIDISGKGDGTNDVDMGADEY